MFRVITSPQQSESLSRPLAHTDDDENVSSARRQLGTHDKIRHAEFRKERKIYRYR